MRFSSKKLADDLKRVLIHNLGIVKGCIDVFFDLLQFLLLRSTLRFYLFDPVVKIFFSFLSFLQHFSFHLISPRN